MEGTTPRAYIPPTTLNIRPMSHEVADYWLTEGTEDWDEDRLAEIVTRDSMIGVAKLPPLEGAGSGTRS